MKKLSTVQKVIFLFIVVFFASTEYAPRVSASTLLVPDTTGPTSYYMTNKDQVCSGTNELTYQIFKGSYPDISDPGNLTPASLGPCNAIGPEFFPLSNVPGAYHDNESGMYYVEFSDGTIEVHVQFYWDGEAVGGLEGATRIISVEPVTTVPLTVFATGTPVDINGFIFINPDDYVAGMKFRQTVFIKNPVLGSQIAGGAITAVNQTLGTVVFEYPITHSGYLDDIVDGLGTTTEFDVIGIRTMTSEITKPSFSFLGLTLGRSSLVYKTDQFLIGTTTLGDKLNERYGNAVDELGLATSTEQTLESCNPLGGSFSITSCLVGLFIPTGGDFGALLNVAREEVLTRAPLGYVTRVVDMFNSSTTEAMPDLVLHLPTGSPVAGTSTIFAVDTAFGSAITIMDTTVSDSGQTLWDLITPVFRILMYMILVMMIVHDVTGVHKHAEKS